MDTFSATGQVSVITGVCQIITTQFNTRVDILKDVLWVNGNFAYSTKKNRDRSAVLSVPYKNGPEMATLYKDQVNSASAASSETKNITFDVYATFAKTFNEKHFVNVVAGFNQEEYRYEYTGMSRNNLITDGLPTIQLATGDMSMSESISTLALRGAYARFNIPSMTNISWNSTAVMTVHHVSRKMTVSYSAPQVLLHGLYPVRNSGNLLKML